MPLWLVGDETPAVGLGMKPDGLLVLEQGSDEPWPALVFVIKETKPGRERLSMHLTEDLCATCVPRDRVVWCGVVWHRMTLPACVTMAQGQGCDDVMWLPKPVARPGVRQR